MKSSDMYFDESDVKGVRQVLSSEEDAIFQEICLWALSGDEEYANKEEMIAAFWKEKLYYDQTSA